MEMRSQVIRDWSCEVLTRKRNRDIWGDRAVLYVKWELAPQPHTSVNTHLIVHTEDKATKRPHLLSLVFQVEDKSQQGVSGLPGDPKP